MAKIPPKRPINLLSRYESQSCIPCKIDSNVEGEMLKSPIFICLAALAQFLPFGKAEAKESLNSVNPEQVFYFDIPQGSADQTFQELSKTLNISIIYLVDSVEGIVFKELQGEMSLNDAFIYLMDGTHLEYSRDPSTGTYVISRREIIKPEAIGSSESLQDTHQNNTMNIETDTDRRRNSMIRNVFRTVASFLTATATVVATAQDIEDEDKVLLLDPFRVDTSQDDGYVATNAISGTRLNTSIKELPIPIEVITADFLDDIGALDVREGLAFSSGVVLDVDFDAGLSLGGSANGRRSFDFSPSGSGGTVGENQFKIRGFTTNVQLRQGFITSGILDSADIGRVEVVRGPAALLYGHSILGGVVNVIPKYPLNQPRFNTSLAVGADNLFRTTFDATGPLFELGLNTLNYRVTVAYENDEDWRDHDKEETFFVAPKFEFQPWNGANIYLDLQYRDYKRSGNGQLDVLSSTRNEFNERIQVARDLGGRPESFRWTGRDHSTEAEEILALIEYRQTIFDWLTFTGGYQYEISDRDRFLIRDIGLRANDNNIPDNLRRPRVNGSNGFEAIRYRWEETPQEARNESTRFEFTGIWDDIEMPLLGLTSHSLVVGQQRIKQTITSTSSNRSDFQWQAYDDFTPFSFGGNYDQSFFRETLDERWQTGSYAVYQGKFWDDKIQLVGGIRYDEYMVRVRDFNYVDGVRRAEPRGSLATDSAGDQRRWNTGPDAVEQGLTGARGSDAPVREGFRFGGIVQSETSPTLGLTFNLNESISLYALTAAGLVPNPGQRDGQGNNFEAERTQSREVGVKFDIIKGQNNRRILSGTASFFQIERENAIWFYSFASSPRNNKGVQRADDPERGGFDPRLPRSFSVDARVFAFLGDEDYVPARPVTHPNQLNDINAGPGGHPASNDGLDRYTINYETLDANPIERQAIEAMLNGFTALDGTFIQADFLGGNSGNRANWTGNSRGSDVSFNDESEGVDVQLIFEPIEGWQTTSTTHTSSV